MRRLWSLLGALVLVGCGDRAVLVVPPGADLLVVAELDRDGSPTTVRAFPAGGRHDLTASPDGRLATFALRASDFMHAGSFTPLGADELEAASIALASSAPPVGSCGRCPALTASSPEPVWAGASCALPAFVPGSVTPPGIDGDLSLAPLEGSLGARVRAGLRIDWPGPCAVPVAPLALSTRGVDLEAIHPEQDANFHGAVAEASDGTLALFRRGEALVIAPDGARTTVRSDLILGYTTIARGGYDGSFFAMTRSPLETELPTMLHVRRDGVRRVDLLPDLEVDPVPMLPLTREESLAFGLASESVLVAGSIKEGYRRPVLAACAVQTDTCEEIAVGTRPAGTFAAIAKTSDGLILLPAGDRLVIVAPGRDHPTREVPIIGEGELQRVAVLGSEVVLLADVGGSATRVFGLTLTRALFDDPAPLVLRAGGRIPAPCTTLIAPRPGRSDRAWANCTPDYQEIDLETLAVLGPVDEGDRRRALGDPTAWIARVIDTWPGRFLAWSPGLVYRLRDEGGVITASRAYGAPTFDDALPALHVDETSGIVVLSDRQRIDVDGAGRVATTPVAGPGPVMGIARDGRGETIAVGWEGDLHGWIARVDGVRFERLDVTPKGRVLGVAALGPGRFVAVGDAWEMWSVEGDVVSPIPVTWDDPATEVFESVPVGDPSCADHFIPDWVLGQLALDQAGWRAVDAGDGVAYAVGCENVIVRVLLGSGGLLATRVGFEAGAVGLPKSLSAVRVLAPDHVVAGGTLDPKNEVGGGAWVEIGPAPAVVARRLVEGVPLRKRDNPGPPRALLGAEGEPLVAVFGWGELRVLGSIDVNNVSTISGAASGSLGRFVTGPGPRLMRLILE